MRVIVPLTIVILAFAAFVIWRVQEGRARNRREKRLIELERDAWIEKYLGATSVEEQTTMVDEWMKRNE